MRFGAVFPQTEIGADPRAVHAFAGGIRELGLDHVLVYDHVLGAERAGHPGFAGPYDHQSMFHEPLVLFGYLAGLVPDIELATGILVLPQRQTALVAKQAAEVDILSGGRLRLGVAVGWNEVEYEGLGMDFRTRGRRLDEQVELLRRLWREPVVTFRGRFERVTSAGINPLPPRREIPIWFGGHAEPALRRSARLGDGHIFARRPRDGWVAAFGRLRDHLAALERDPGQFGLEALVRVGRDDAETWRLHATELRAAGATHVTLETMGGGLSGVDAHLMRLREALAVVRGA